MTPDFDRIAPFYSPLSKLVFGRSQIRAQEYFIPAVSPGSRILIAGGGNGAILPALAAHLSGTDSEVFFIEPAPRMLRLARRTHCGPLRIHFIQSTTEEFLRSAELSFDAILTGFFFDLFPPEKADSLLAQLNLHLKPGGVWLHTDFRLSPGRPWWHAPLLKAMYLFFRKVSGVQASSLPEIQFPREFRLLEERTFYGRFIAAQLWKKDSNGPGENFRRRIFPQQ